MMTLSVFMTIGFAPALGDNRMSPPSLRRQPHGGAVITATSLARSATTGADGVYTFDGTDIVGHTAYPIKVEATGYTSTSIMVNVSDSNVPAGSSADVFLSPTVSPGEFRFVLRWGAQPRDLDSHLLFSTADGGCEVLFSSKACGATGGLSATLDQDRTTGYGPETISIVDTSVAKGDLTHFVYIYAGDPTAFLGKANVQLYGSTGLLAQLTVAPSSAGRYWETWKLRADGSFETVNAVTSSKPSPAA